MRERIKSLPTLNMKELILLGRGPSWKQCPYDAEVWAASTVLLDPEARIDRISRVFAFDPLSVDDIRQSVELAKAHSIPVVSIEDYATEPYPLLEIGKKYQFPYFNNTISYMLGMAIFQGYEKIRLFGVDQGPHWKYIANKPYVMFWMGVAIGQGVEVEISSNCLLFEPFLEELKKSIIDKETWQRISVAIAKQL